jgi:hemoglobin-like flavoprotein
MDRASYGPLVLDSLERLARRGVDPAPHVYARLFAESPELEPLFILGPDAKGHMLDQVFGVILDHVEAGRYASAFLRSERVNHADLGVAPEQFMRFFEVLADTLQALAGDAWSPAHERAWRALIADLSSIA